MMVSENCFRDEVNDDMYIGCSDRFRWWHKGDEPWELHIYIICLYILAIVYLVSNL